MGATARNKSLNFKVSPDFKKEFKASRSPKGSR
ncbi:hypothetical protein NVSP9465_03923 [Novosphingobium sp. CECT 9465]|nr:hypothetical protein NVSP9465_03923 [Novosphingobium sp. CECT 9465]